MNFSASSNYSGKQFAIFRIVFGSYLAWHFSALVPYAEELFGVGGVLGGNSPFMGAWPNPLFIDGWHHLPVVLIVLGVVAALAFTLGRLRHTSSIYLWYLSTCLFTANPLIANPSIAYVGMLLLACTIIPLGEPFVLLKAGQADWKMPAMIPFTVWVLLAVGYTFSGILKLSSPSWIDGSALRHVLENPLARPNALREYTLSLPDGFLTTLTWGTLALEILFLPLVLLRSTRRWIWLAMLVMHFGIITVIDFADLSLGMVMVHLFTFQYDWMPERWQLRWPTERQASERTPCTNRQR